MTYIRDNVMYSKIERLVHFSNGLTAYPGDILRITKIQDENVIGHLCNSIDNELMGKDFAYPKSSVHEEIRNCYSNEFLESIECTHEVLAEIIKSEIHTSLIEWISQINDEILTQNVLFEKICTELLKVYQNIEIIRFTEEELTKIFNIVVETVDFYSNKFHLNIVLRNPVLKTRTESSSFSLVSRLQYHEEQIANYKINEKTSSENKRFCPIMSEVNSEALFDLELEVIKYELCETNNFLSISFILMNEERTVYNEIAYRTLKYDDQVSSRRESSRIRFLHINEKEKNNLVLRVNIHKVTQCKQGHLIKKFDRNAEFFLKNIRDQKKIFVIKFFSDIESGERNTFSTMFASKSSQPEISINLKISKEIFQINNYLKYQHFMGENSHLNCPDNFQILPPLYIINIPLPGYIREDFYILVKSAELDKTLKPNGHTVQFRMTIRDTKNNRLNCILDQEMSIDSSQKNKFITNEYRSAIYSRNNQPEWNCLVKIVSKTEELEDKYLVLEFYQFTNKEKNQEAQFFGYSATKLNSTSLKFKNENSLSLIIYRENDIQKVRPDNFSRKRFTVTDTRSSMVHKDSVKLKTILCSTSYTSNDKINHLMKWKTIANVDFLIKCLNEVDQLEVAEFNKFSMRKAIVESLVELMSTDQHHNAIRIEREVTVAWLKLFKKFQNNNLSFEHIFSFIGDRDKFIKKFLSMLIPLFEDFQSGRVLQSYLETSILIFEEILTCSKNNCQLESFKKLCSSVVKECIENLIKIVQNLDPVHVTLHKLIFERFCNWFKILDNFDLLSISDLSELIRNSLKTSEMELKKIDSIRNKNHRDIEKHEEIFLNNKLIYLGCLVKNFKQFIIFIEKDDFFKEIFLMILGILSPYACEQNHDLLLDILLNLIGILKEPVMDEKFFQSAFKVLHKNFMEELNFNYIIGANKSNKIKRKRIVVMIAIIDEIHLEEYFRHYDIHLNEIENFLTSTCFPDNWIHLNYPLFEKVIAYLDRLLKQNLINEKSFDWYTISMIIDKIFYHPQLQIQEFSDNQKNFLKYLFGDLRNSNFKLLRTFFEKNIKGKENISQEMKIDFLKRIISIIFLGSKELLENGLDLLKEFYIFLAGNTLEAQRINDEVIHCVEEILKKNESFITQTFADDLIHSFSVLMEGENSFLFILLKELTDLHKYLKNADQRKLKLKKILCLTELSNFFRSLENLKEDYFYYVQKLLSIFDEKAYYLNAAKLLHEQAKEMLCIAECHQEGTSNEKEEVYLSMLNFYDKAKYWEYGLAIGMELIEFYMNNNSLHKLASIHNEMSQYYEKLCHNQRIEWNFYLIKFYLKENIVYLKSSMYIFNSPKTMSSSEFQEELRREFPDFKICTATTRKLLPQDNQNIIEISVLNGNVEQLNDGPRWMKFEFDRSYHIGTPKKDNEFLTIHIERSTMMTKIPIPNHLIWTPVDTVKSLTLKPIHVAIDTVKKKTKNIISLINTPNVDLNSLTMVLNGVLDAAVNGGTKKYLEAFITTSYLNESSDGANSVLELISELVEQLDPLNEGIEICKTRASPSLQGLIQRFDECFYEAIKEIINALEGITESPTENINSVIKKQKAKLNKKLDMRNCKKKSRGRVLSIDLTSFLNKEERENCSIENSKSSEEQISIEIKSKEPVEEKIPRRKSFLGLMPKIEESTFLSTLKGKDDEFNSLGNNNRSYLKKMFSFRKKN